MSEVDEVHKAAYGYLDRLEELFFIESSYHGFDPDDRDTWSWLLRGMDAAWHDIMTRIDDKIREQADSGSNPVRSI